MRTSLSLRARRLQTPIAVLAAVWLFAGPSRAIARQPEAAPKQAVVTVRGMQCPFCAYGIQKQLKKLAGVARVQVELEKNQAVVTLAPGATVTGADIQRAIRKAGFTPGKIEWKTAP